MVQHGANPYHRIMMFRATQLYVRTRTAVSSCFSRERGAGMVEYALLVALIAIVLIVAISFFAGKLNTEFSSIATAVEDA